MRQFMCLSHRVRIRDLACLIFSNSACSISPSQLMGYSYSYVHGANLRSSYDPTLVNAGSFCHTSLKLMHNDAKFRYSKKRIMLDKVSDVTDVIRRNPDDAVRKLASMNLHLSVDAISGVFSVLNRGKISALGFFEWVTSSHGGTFRKGDICSLVIDNCGLLSDYDTMLLLLKDFKRDRVCLSKRAFGFVSSLVSGGSSGIERIVTLLNEVGGAPCFSGIHALISVLCAMESFDLAKSVIKNSERKVIYYNVLVKEKCEKCGVQEAKDIIDEMLHLGCEPCWPNVQTYNYLLSSMCRSNIIDDALNLVKDMEERKCFPDALSYEGIVCFFCRKHRMDSAYEWLNRMVVKGIKPRFSTHTAILNAFFFSGKCKEALEFARNSIVKYVFSSNDIYSWLVNLHFKKGSIVTAAEILMEMMEKGLKPNFSVYLRVLKHLKKSNESVSTKKLQSLFSKFQASSCQTVKVG